MERVCYFAVVLDETGQKLVRCGFSRRVESQVFVSHDVWSKVSEHLARKGYRLVNTSDKKKDDGG